MSKVFLSVFWGVKMGILKYKGVATTTDVFQLGFLKEHLNGSFRLIICKENLKSIKLKNYSPPSKCPLLGEVICPNVWQLQCPKWADTPTMRNFTCLAWAIQETDLHLEENWQSLPPLSKSPPRCSRSENGKGNGTPIPVHVFPASPTQATQAPQKVGKEIGFQAAKGELWELCLDSNEWYWTNKLSHTIFYHLGLYESGD